jgi:hypothetical protein
LSEAEKSIDWLLSLEDSPFTLNTHYLADYQDKFIAYYKGTRQNDINQDFLAQLKGSGAEITKDILSNLVQLGVHGAQPFDLAKLLPPDKMEPAIGIMAEIRSYFQGKRSVLFFALSFKHSLPSVL